MNRAVAAVAIGLMGLVAAPSQAQDAQVVKEDISFKTFDGVLIKGTFYPSQKGGPAPVVMFLHKLGGNRTQDGWEGLAAKLQKKGYAVLAFDFRGHGASTEIVEPALFWSRPHNINYLTKVDSKKKFLSFTEFRQGYIPYLVNDIAAARHDLDNRNDTGSCNTSNIVLIGAEEGAALGFFWAVTEFHRSQIYKGGNLLQVEPGVANTDVAGEDIAGAIWLSFRRSPGLKADRDFNFPYARWMATNSAGNSFITPLRDRIPMWFAAGASDAKGKADAHYMYDTVLHADKAKQKLELTSKKEVPGTNLRGVSLLGEKTLNTDDLIEKFIDIAVKKRPNQAPLKRNASAYKPPWIEPSKFGF
jgi:pimeloyl-ACP methyl ester carboxylesterase